MAETISLPQVSIHPKLPGGLNSSHMYRLLNLALIAAEYETETIRGDVIREVTDIIVRVDGLLYQRRLEEGLQAAVAKDV